MDDLVKMQLKLAFYQDNLNFWKHKLEDYKTYKQKYIDCVKKEKNFDCIPNSQYKAHIEELVDKAV